MGAAAAISLLALASFGAVLVMEVPYTAHDASSVALEKVTASVSNKVVSISVADDTPASTVYVKVKATTTSGVSQTATATITVKVILPTISQGTVNTYQGGTVSIQPTIAGQSIDGKTVTYTMTGHLPD